MDVYGTVLYKILEQPSECLEQWAKLKRAYFPSTYTSIYTAIYRYYDTHRSLPSFSELNLFNRDRNTKKNLAALELLEIPEEVTIDLALEVLVNEYAQKEALTLLSSYLDNIAIYDIDEIKNGLTSIALHIEEKTFSSNSVLNIANIATIDKEEQGTRVFLGLNNDMDASTIIKLSDTIIIGGTRGSGKSAICANVAANQFRKNKTTVYFTIEMRARAIYDRLIAILAEVPARNLQLFSLTKEEEKRVAKVKANMFNNPDFYKELNNFACFQDWEKELISSNELSDTQLIIIDNPKMTLMDVDLHLQTLKAKFGDSLDMVIIDPLNKLIISEKDNYDWKAQISISDKLKVLAEKYKVVIVTPIQIDEQGTARFAKGILDSPDLGMKLAREGDKLDLISTKTRNSSSFKVVSTFNEETLKITPTYTQPVIDEEEDELMP